MKRTAWLMVGLLVVSLPVAMADDIQPPPWRGQYSTTSQMWEFNYVPPMGPPYEYKPDGPAPNGMPPLPSTTAWVTPGAGLGWLAFDPMSQREGIWQLSGRIEVLVDNHEPPNEFKWVWVQVTWRPADVGEIPILHSFQPLPDLQYMPRIVAEEDLGNGWTETTYDWRIYPNPVDEFFIISGSIDVDELVIDTWCIPEPGTVFLLILGGLAMMRRRRLA